MQHPSHIRVSGTELRLLRVPGHTGVSVATGAHCKISVAAGGNEPELLGLDTGPNARRASPAPLPSGAAAPSSTERAVERHKVEVSLLRPGAIRRRQGPTRHRRRGRADGHPRGRSSQPDWQMRHRTRRHRRDDALPRHRHPGEHLVGSFSLTDCRGHLYGDDKSPPILKRLSHQVGDDPPRGALMQVDVVDLEFHDLAELEGLRVLRSRSQASPGPSPEGSQRPPSRGSRPDRPARSSPMVRRTRRPSRRSLSDRIGVVHYRVVPSVPPSPTAAAMAPRAGAAPPPPVCRLRIPAPPGTRHAPHPDGRRGAVRERGGCADTVAAHGGYVSIIEQYCVVDDAGPQWHDWPRAWVSVVIAPAKLVRLTDAASPLPYFRHRSTASST